MSICLMNMHFHEHPEDFNDHHNHHSDIINNYENCAFCNLNNDNIFNEFSVFNDFNIFEILFFSNPFNNSVTIPYNIHTKSNVTIIISNVLGQKILSYHYQNKPPGNYKILWNGNNDRNVSVSGGVYLVTLKTDSFIDYKKIVLLK